MRIHEDMPVEMLVANLLEYLKELQRGRSKPNKKGPGDVHESLDNVGDIAAVKDKLAKIFNLDLEMIDTINTEVKEKSISNDYREYQNKRYQKH